MFIYEIIDEYDLNYKTILSVVCDLYIGEIVFVCLYI